MPYTKEEVGSLSVASNNLLIFSSAAEVVYPIDPAYRDLYIDGNKVVYKNFVVSDGGIVSVGSSSVLSGAQVYSGGVVSILSSAVLISNTIHSGGAVVIPANANPKMIFSGLVLESGASLDATGNNGTAWMMKPTIAKGTLVAAPNAYTDENGTLHNYVGSKNGNWYFSGTDFDNVTLTSGRLVVSNATVTTAKTNAKGYLHIGPSATVINANVTAGFIAFGTTANNGIGGSKTTMNAGYVYISPTTGGTIGSATKNEDISVTNGVMTGLTVRAAITGVDYIAKLRLLDGITVNAPVVDVGGSLTLSSGAKATDVSVVSGGILYVSGGEVDGGTFTDGGKLYLGSGAKLGGATLDVGAGYVYIADALSDVSITAGTVTGLDLTDFELTLNSGLTLNGAALNDGAVLKLADGVTATAAVTVGGGAELNGGTFTAGTPLQLLTGAAIGGAALTVGAGDVYFDGTVTGVSVADGVLNDLSLASGQTLTVVDGLTVEAPTVAAGGALKIGDGATLSGGTVAAGGELHLLDGTVISGAALNVASGGVYLNGTLDADAYIAAGKMYNFDIPDMDLAVGANVVLYDGTIADGGRVVLDGTSAGLVNGTVASGGVISNGGYNYVVLKNVTLAEGASVKTGGGTFVLAGTENNIAKGTLINAPDAYTDENGVVHDYRAVSAVQFQSGIQVQDLEVAAVTHVYAGATARNVTQRGSWLVIAGSAVSVDNTSGGNVALGYTANPTLGGADTNILEGTLWFSVNNTYGVNSRVLAEGVAVTNGEMTGLYLVNEGKWLQKLRLVEGMSATAVVVSNGGSLTIGSGGAVNGATVSAGGYLGVAADGEARGAVVIENGGRLDGGAFAAGATLKLMGGASIGAAGWAIDSGSIYLGEMLDADAYAADGVLYNLTLADQTLHLKNLTSVADAELNDGAVLNVSEGATAGGALNAGGKMDVKAGGVARDITMNGGTLTVAAGAAVEGATVNSNGILTVSNGVTYRDVVINSSGGITFAAGAVVAHLTLQKNAGVSGSGTANCVIIGGNNVVVNDLEVYGFAFKISGGARVNDMVVHSGGSARVWNNGTVHGAVVEKGGSALAMYKSVKVYDFTVFGSATVNSSATAYDMTVSSGGSFLLQGGFCSGAEIYDGGLLNAKYYYYSSTGASSAAYDLGAEITNLGVYSGGSAILSSGCVIHGGTIHSGGALVAQGGGSIEGLTAGEGANVKLVYTANLPKDTAVFDTMANVTSVNMTGIVAGSSYVLTAADAATTVIKSENGLYGNGVVKGETYTNAFDGLTYSFDGTTYSVAAQAIADAAAAGALTAGVATTINGSDLAAKWNSGTTYSTNVYLAANMTTGGNAWLDIEGFNAAANLYGADKNQNFAGQVNIKAATGSIKNLAGGAALGGKVGGVKLTVGNGMSVTGAVYAGGMGDVTGKTETLVSGGAFAGNVFAGALCNYAANTTATATGDIALTVNGGTFDNNIYAGAAVKAGAATGIVHTAGDITVELNGGTAAKNAFCVYGGGYAVGTGSNKVYTADDVDITVNGGSWGSYATGRGIFGGVYADKVAASVQSVNITVAGGTMGNVYGGGWAQNGGTSTVMGAVKITVSGNAAVDNVFGGGSYSASSLGATSVGSVYITVEGGAINNNIFAAGQNAYSTVAGDVVVVFKGANNYACNVYGYGTPESATIGGDKTLGFAGYTGTLSGAVGGFDGIVFTGDTAATLSNASIDNDDWTFDYTGRTLAADLAMATFDGGTFYGDTVAVDLADVEQVAGGWSIAAGLTSAEGAKFGVELSTGSAANLGLGDTLGAAYGVYEGWGFALEDITLKFKQLA